VEQTTELQSSKDREDISGQSLRVRQKTWGYGGLSRWLYGEHYSSQNVHKKLVFSWDVLTILYCCLLQWHYVYIYL